MKHFLSLFLIISITFSCRKKEEQSVVPVNPSSSQQKLATTDFIPADILKLLYDDYIKEGQPEKAESLKQEYDFTTGAKRKISGGANQRATATTADIITGTWYEFTNNKTWQYAGNATQAHLSGIGWTSTPFNNMQNNSELDNSAPPANTYLGTVNQNRKIEAIKLPYLKFTNANGIDAQNIVAFRYKSHVAGIGWQEYVDSDVVSGTTGQSRAIQAVNIALNPQTRVATFPNCLCLYTVKLFYRAHVQSIGWMPWVAEDQLAGTTGRNLRMEALQVKAYLVR